MTSDEESMIPQRPMSTRNYRIMRQEEPEVARPYFVARTTVGATVRHTIIAGGFVTKREAESAIGDLVRQDREQEWKWRRAYGPRAMAG